MTEKPVITVVGGGNGGFCMAADLTLKGFEVRLLELPAFAHTIEPVIEHGGIVLRGVTGEGFATLAMVTTDVGAALHGADVIMVVVPAMGHKTIAQKFASFLADGQIVVLTPGCCGGVLEFQRELRAAKCKKNVILAETASLMYAVKKEGTNGVWARGLKHQLPLAAFPADQTSKVLELLHEAFPQFESATNILEVSLSNLNHIAHPPPVLTNIGLISSKRIEEWFLYTDGCTKGACHLAEQLDDERLAVMRAYGLQQIPMVEWVNRYYGHLGMAGENMWELFHDSPVHRTTHGPKSTQSRLITEDIPYGLVPMASFGKAAGVPTPIMDSLITLASAINKTDYRQTGRTIESLGMAGLSVDEIVQVVTEG